MECGTRWNGVESTLSTSCGGDAGGVAVSVDLGVAVSVDTVSEPAFGEIEVCEPKPSGESKGLLVARAKEFVPNTPNTKVAPCNIVCNIIRSGIVRDGIIAGLLKSFIFFLRFN